MGRRILWLDGAKAIAIVAMIIGHVVPLESSVRTLIFSFHMPLFFIATGFTHKEPQDYIGWWKQVKKDIKRILLPCVIACAVSVAFSVAFDGFGVLAESARYTLDGLLWSSAVEVKGHAALGALWFLVALFWGKTLFGLTQVMFPGINRNILYLFFALTSWVLSQENLWLPQAMDIVPIILTFLAVGEFLRSIYQNTYKKYSHWIVPGAFLLWSICVIQGINIEIGTRYYPFFWLSILEAIAGSICVFALAEVLCQNAAVSTMLTFIGRHTLALLCIHTLDWPVAFLWNGQSVWRASILRLIVDLILLVCFVGLKYILFDNLLKKARN